MVGDDGEKKGPGGEGCIVQSIDIWCMCRGAMVAFQVGRPEHIFQNLHHLEGFLHLTARQEGHQSERFSTLQLGHIGIAETVTSVSYTVKTSKLIVTLRLEFSIEPIVKPWREYQVLPNHLGEKLFQVQIDVSFFFFF